MAKYIMQKTHVKPYDVRQLCSKNGWWVGGSPVSFFTFSWRLLHGNFPFFHRLTAVKLSSKCVCVSELFLGVANGPSGSKFLRSEKVVSLYLLFLQMEPDGSSITCYNINAGVKKLSPNIYFTKSFIASKWRQYPL